MSPSRRLRNTKLVKGEWVSDSYWVGEQAEETRQHFANVMVARHQHWRNPWTPPVAFANLLSAFREYGKMYDRGARLRDFERAA